MSSELFPGTDDVLLYHAPKEVVSLPAESVVPFMLKQLDEQAALPYADFETTLGLGQLARLMKLEGIQSELEAWVQGKDEAKGNDTAALFLAGFWPDNPKPSQALVERFLAFLALHTDSLQVVETLLLALSQALATEDQALRDRIRDGLRQLLPLYPLLQVTSQTSLRYGLPIPEDQLPQTRPDRSEFRAYSCKEGADSYVSVEHTPSRYEVVRVFSIDEDAGTLRITYEINVLTFNDRFAQDLIAQTVLLDLCQDRFRAKNDQVEYLNPSRRKSTTVAYPKAAPTF